MGTTAPSRFEPRRFYMGITRPDGFQETVDCGQDPDRCLKVIDTLKVTAENWTIANMYEVSGNRTVAKARWGFMGGKATRLGYRR